MSENNYTTMRVSKETLARLRLLKPSPGTSDEWILTWLLDQYDELSQDIKHEE